MVTTKQLGQFHAVPYHLLSSMTVTQNAVRREGLQHRLVVLSCWFVSQQRSVGSPRLKVVSHCGETRALWQATPTQHAALQNDTSGSPFWICNEVWALTTAFNYIKKTHCSRCWQRSLLSTMVWWTGKRTQTGTGRQWVIQHKRHESCVPVFDPAKLSNEQWAHMGETAFRGRERHNEEKKNISVHVILGACVFTLLLLLSCQMVPLFKAT